MDVGEDYDAFQAEIAAIEAAGGGEEGADGEAGPGDAPASPEEKEFEDDDGTWCVVCLPLLAYRILTSSNDYV